MGYFIEYASELIEVWVCDTCNNHCTVVNKLTGEKIEISRDAKK